jgi:hypothetical protein
LNAEFIGLANGAEAVGRFEEGFGRHATTEDAESAQFAGSLDDGNI